MLRHAIESDENILLDWQRDPSTRLYARDPSLPSAHSHRAWFLKRLRDDQDLLLMGEYNKQTVGVVYLNSMRSGCGSEISIVIAPEIRRQGIGSSMLFALRRYMPHLTLWAFIKPENIISQRCFLKAGFTHQQGHWYVSTP